MKRLLIEYQVFLSRVDEIEKFLSEHCKPDDLLITMGAGDIVSVAESLVSR